MRRLLALLSGMGIATLLAFPPDDRVLADGPTATFDDWHLTVLDVERTTRAGAPHPVPADGVFYVVTVQTIGRDAFDATVADAQGRTWTRALDVEQMLPGGSRRLVFDVDDRAVAPVLEVRRSGSRRVVEIPLDPGPGT